MGLPPSSRQVDDPDIRTCSTCGSVGTHWFAFDEEPVQESADAWVCRSRIICYLCVSSVVAVVTNYGDTTPQ